MNAAPGTASGSARLARHEDGEIARGRRHQLLARHHARAQVRHRAATVEHLGRAHQPPGLHGAKVADGDVDGGANLPRRQHGVQRRAHARVGQREHHRAVHHAVRVQVLRRQRQAEHAVAGALRLHLQVDQVGKGMVHGRRGQKSEGVNESRVPERSVQTRPIKAQSAAMARAMASICNAERAGLGAQGGHVGFVHTFSDTMPAGASRPGATHGSIAEALGTICLIAADAGPAGAGAMKQALLANDGEALDQCCTATRRTRKINSHTQRTQRIRRGRKENRWIFLLSASSAKSLRPLRSDVGGFQ